MPRSAQELLVFVGSPSDCSSERESAQRVAKELSEALAPTSPLRIRVTGWEYSPPDHGRPQDQINPLVDDCDVFVGILGHRWGTQTGTHSSGFVEEYERTVARRNDDGHPHIALFFREISSERREDPGPQLLAVMDFQRRIREEQIALYETFSSPQDFESSLWRLLVRIALKQVAIQGQATDSSDSIEPSDHARGSAEDVTGALLDEAPRQIAATASAVAALAEGRHPEDLDTDRLLLLALALNRDGGKLPPHVANRLYRKKDEIEISQGEYRVWRDSLLSDVGTNSSPEFQVIPGWALLGSVSEALQNAPFYLSDNKSVTLGGLRVLHRLGQRLETLWDTSSTDTIEEVAERWSLLLGEARTRDEALEYLASLATPEDRSMIEAIAQFDDPAVSSLVSSLEALLAGDPEPMASTLAEHSSRRPPRWQEEVISDHITALADITVRGLALNQALSPEFRLKSLEELQRRDLITEEVIEGAFDQKRTALWLIDRAGDPNSTVSATAVTEVANRLEVGDKPLSTDDRLRAITSSTDDLIALLDDDLFAAFSAWLALAWKQDHTVAPLESRARAIFDSNGDALLGETLNADTSDVSDKVTQYLRGQSRVAALRILMAGGDVEEQDKERVFAEVERGDWRTTSDALALAASIAGSGRLDLLIANLPGAWMDEQEALVGRILQIGGRPAAERLLELSLATGSREMVLEVLVTNSSDLELDELLHSKSSDIRWSAAQEFASRSDDDELVAKLETYPGARSSYYYNVMAELDWILFAQET